MQNNKGLQILLLTVWVVLTASRGMAMDPPAGITVAHLKDNAFEVSWQPAEDKGVMGYAYQLDSSPVVNWTQKTKVTIRAAGKGNHRFYVCSMTDKGEVSPYAATVIDYAGNTLTPSSAGSCTTYQTGAWPAGIAVGDVNGDGLNDVVCANYNDNTISVFVQDDNGRLLDGATYSTFLNPLGVGIGDIDLDGRNEVSVVCAGADIMNIFGQAKTGGLINIANYATERAPYGLSMGDINGDARNDIVVANLGAESISIFTWLANLPKTYYYLYHSFAFAKKMTLKMEGDKIFAYIVYPAGKMPFGIDIGDINMDGAGDVVCVNYQSGDMNIFLQESSILKPSGSMTTGSNPTGVRCGDINSDYIAEVVTTSLGSGMISVFNPDGLMGTYATRDGRSGGVDIGDINNDGRPDVAVSNDTSNTVSIFIQNKDDRLNPQTACETGRSPGSCRIADINNDGINEVITGDAQSNTLTVQYPAR